MGKINVLDQNTINRIAAGEVIDRPSSIVKELMENAIDAHATSITIEIKDGGMKLIRITDNGDGMAKDDVRVAFLRHTTSKIKSAEDLVSVGSLGFRGEALSSIAAVCQVELLTKQAESLYGTRYVIEGGQEHAFEEIGIPNGTTFIIRNIFFNTPARRKFLKTAATETGYITDIVEKIALSHPEVSVVLKNNNDVKIHTSGNGKLKDTIYSLYGRDIAKNLMEFSASDDFVTIQGYIGKPVVTRGNRGYENYFINGRYIKSKIVSKAIEEGYKTFMMQHMYPFTALSIDIDSNLVDVNVHPSKMELRFKNGSELYNLLQENIRKTLANKDLIRTVTIDVKKVDEKQTDTNSINTKTTDVNPVDTNSLDVRTWDKINDETNAQSNVVSETSNYTPEPFENSRHKSDYEITKKLKEEFAKDVIKDAIQESFISPEVNNGVEKPVYRIIGQVFETYWIIEYKNSMYIIDQHAAHEKVMYEKFSKQYRQSSVDSQLLSPPAIITLSAVEESLVNTFMDNFKQLGFDIEPFGGKEYTVRAVPYNLVGLNYSDVLHEIIGSLDSDTGTLKSVSINDRIATMSCKAAVKGNTLLSYNEADKLINELLQLENPFNCPHGRPTIIEITKYEMEKKFKRIV